MLKPLNVLMVEDSEDDALLLMRELRKAGYDPQAQRVETADDMAYALMSRPWGVIFCDYHMPAFSGLDAIALLKKTDVDVPLIIVSGAIGEETALDCIHRGASDFIMKGHFARLGMVVARETEKREMRRKQKEAEEALRQSEEKYRSILESIEDGYYEADLDGNFTFFNAALCRIWGYPADELMGMNSRAYTDIENGRRLHKAHVQTFQTGNPVRLFENEIVQKNGNRRVVQSSFAVLKNKEGKVIGFRGVTRDVTDLKALERDRLENTERLRQSLTATINAVAVMVESRDPYTAGHQRRVADLAYAIALAMGMDADQAEGLKMAAMIHDLGKISIPSEILTKPTKLSNIEFEIVKTHAQAGYEILKDMTFPWPIARMVAEHHEKINGSGYPNGLSADSLLAESKILVVADVVEAMASHRPYRPSLGIAPALEEIQKNKGVLYDADVVNTCLRLFEEERFMFTN